MSQTSLTRPGSDTLCSPGSALSSGKRHAPVSESDTGSIRFKEDSSSNLPRKRDRDGALRITDPAEHARRSLANHRAGPKRTQSWQRECSAPSTLPGLSRAMLASTTREPTLRLKSDGAHPSEFKDRARKSHAPPDTPAKLRTSRTSFSLSVNRSLGTIGE